MRAATDAAALHLLGCARIRDAAGHHAELARTPARVRDGAGLRAEPARPVRVCEAAALDVPATRVRDTAVRPRHHARPRPRPCRPAAQSLRLFARKEAVTAPPSRGASGRSPAKPRPRRRRAEPPAGPRPRHHRSEPPAVHPRGRDPSARESATPPREDHDRFRMLFYTARGILVF